MLLGLISDSVARRSAPMLQIIRIITWKAFGYNLYIIYIYIYYIIFKIVVCKGVVVGSCYLSGTNAQVPPMLSSSLKLSQCVGLHVGPKLPALSFRNVTIGLSVHPAQLSCNG